MWLPAESTGLVAANPEKGGHAQLRITLGVHGHAELVMRKGISAKYMYVQILPSGVMPHPIKLTRHDLHTTWNNFKTRRVRVQHEFHVYGLQMNEPVKGSYM